MVGVFKSFGNTDTNGVIGRRGRVTLQTNAGGGTVRDVEFFHAQTSEMFRQTVCQYLYTVDAPPLCCVVKSQEGQIIKEGAHRSGVSTP